MFASGKEKKKRLLKNSKKTNQREWYTEQPNKMDTIANTIPVYNSKYTTK